MSKNKGIAFIPVRCGSKSIPMKNIKHLCGKPLIYWCLESLEHASSIEKVIVATDCKEIAECSMSFGFKKVEIYHREPENATDTSSTESVILEYLSKHHYADTTPFFLVQATNPFTTTADFDKALNQLASTNSDSLITCAINKHFFWDESGVALNYDYANRPRRQDFKGILAENGAFYINSIKNILKSKNRLSGKITVYQMPTYSLTEIDEEEDWIIVENLMKRFRIEEKQVSQKVKLFITDVDGVLTDAGMYYSEKGDELKKFNTRDGKGLEIIRKRGIKTAIITSEDTKMVANRARKLKVDFLYQGKHNGGKLEAIQQICKKEELSLEQVAYIGDDINCFEALSSVGFAACPKDAMAKIKSISGIKQLNKKGGEGVVREFIELLLFNNEI